MKFKNTVFLSFWAIGLVGCTQSPSTAQSLENPDTTAIKSHYSLPESRAIEAYGIQMNLDSTESYSSIKASLIKPSRSLPADSISTIFTEQLLNKIIPYWYGTTWSFEGHTSKPNQGEIACGYFVSTTLRDMGMNLNRYKLAQQSPINEAKTLSLDQPVFEVNHATNQENIAALKAQMKEGIYFIGFDQNHVGYILKRQGDLLLIHSNYVAGKVEIERIEESEAFAYYQRFYLAEITTNEALMERWLSNEEVKVKMEP